MNARLNKVNEEKDFDTLGVMIDKSREIVENKLIFTFCAQVDQKRLELVWEVPKTAEESCFKKSELMERLYSDIDRFDFVRMRSVRLASDQIDPSIIKLQPNWYTNILRVPSHLCKRLASKCRFGPDLPDQRLFSAREIANGQRILHRPIIAT